MGAAATCTQQVAEPHSAVLTPPSFDRVHELLAGTKPLTWVFTGDGVTVGDGLGLQHRNFVEIFAARLRRSRALDAVVNTAVSGETAAGLLEDLEWRSLRFRPDVVVVMLGIDEILAEPSADDLFRDALRQLVGCIRADGGIPVLQTPNRVLEHGSVDLSALRARVRVIREIVYEADVPCIDHWGRWKQRQIEGTDLNEWLTADGLHPNAVGHRQIEGLLGARLGLRRRVSTPPAELP